MSVVAAIIWRLPESLLKVITASGKDSQESPGMQSRVCLWPWSLSQTFLFSVSWSSIKAWLCWESFWFVSLGSWKLGNLLITIQELLLCSWYRTTQISPGKRSELDSSTQEGVEGGRNHQPWEDVCVAPNLGQTCFCMQRVVVNAEGYSWSKYSVCSPEHGSSLLTSTLTVPENFAEGALERMEGEPCPTYIRGTTGSRWFSRRGSHSLKWTQLLVCYLPCGCPHTHV